MHVRKLNMSLMILFCATMASTGPIAARGFCNVDHAGDDMQMKAVAAAAAAFYEGAEGLMGMLKAFELSDQSALQEKADAAAGSFDRSAQAYLGAVNAFSADSILSKIDYKMVATMSRVNDASVLARAEELASKGAAALLQECSDKAKALSLASKEFPGQVASDPRTVEFSELLRSFSEALSFGTVVSAAFANAGGEKE